MKKLIILALVLGLSISCFADIEKFYIRDIEISKENYAALDTTLIQGYGVYTDQDTTKHKVEPSLFAKIDSTSMPGSVFLVKRSQSEIDMLLQFLKQQRTETAVLKVGDTFPKGEIQNLTFFCSMDCVQSKDLDNKVVLLNFWATWCGPCVEELKQVNLPNMLDEFMHRSDFLFIPISTNHTKDELEEFFQSERGKDLSWLKDIFLWDESGVLSQRVNNGGIPVTIIIDKNGVIQFNESGAFLNETDKNRLKTKIHELFN